MAVTAAAREDGADWLGCWTACQSEAGRCVCAPAGTLAPETGVGHGGVRFAGKFTGG